MTAKVSYLSFWYDDMVHTWTAGRDYDIHDDDDCVYVESDAGGQRVPKDCFNTGLFDEVFGYAIEP